MAQFDEVKREKYLEKLREGGRRGLSAAAVGVSDRTVRRHCASDPGFAEQVSLAEQEGTARNVEAIEGALFERAMQGHVTAMIFALCNLAPQRWRSVQHIVASVPDDGVEERRQVMARVVQSPELLDRLDQVLAEIGAAEDVEDVEDAEVVDE